MIDYRIVAVPERLHLAEALHAQVGGKIIVDDDRAGTFRTHQRALASAVSDHVVVLEDDAILCADFTHHVAELIEERQDHLIGLYVGQSHPHRVQPLIGELVTAGLPWLDHPKLTARLRWGVGYVMPTRDVPEVLKRLALGDQHPWADADGRIGAWHAARERLSYPFPSPVDHDNGVPSTTSHGRAERVAWKHCGRCAR